MFVLKTCLISQGSDITINPTTQSQGATFSLPGILAT
jgi:hypothetical protein